MESNYKRLGNYIQQVDVRNTDLEVDLLLGVSIDKKFIESHANTVGTDFSKYKIVKKGQFAYGPVTSRNGDKISIALLKEDSCLVSSSYTPFEITKPEELNADYLMLLFSNPEFDRYARYNSWGSAREIFSWEDFCDSMLYIPDITEQEQIVRQYKTITNRIDVLEKINEKLEECVDIVYDDFMQKYENIDGTITDLGEFVRGKNITAAQMVNGEIDVISAGIKPSGLHNKWNVAYPSITISGSGVNAGYFSLHFENIWAADCSYVNNIKHIFFLYETLKIIKDKIEELKDGHSAQQHVYAKDVNIIPIKMLSEDDICKFEEVVSPLFEVIATNIKEIKKLYKLLNIFIEKIF